MENNAVAIVTGSVAQVPQDQQERLGIRVIPFTIQLNGKSYLDDGSAISATEIYRIMRTSDALPTTAAPSSGEYISTFQSLFEEGYKDIVYISLSEKLSSDYTVACGIAEALTKQNSGHRVYVYDSMSAAVAQGFLAIEAAERAERGETVQQILHWLDEAKSRAGLVACVDSLKYLARTGRIGKASKFLGSLLDVKPILSIVDGEVAPIAIQRGSKKILPAILETTQKKIEGWKKLRLAVFHADDLPRAEELRQMTRNALQFQEDISIDEFTPMMGVHTGPGVVGLGYYFE